MTLLGENLVFSATERLDFCLNFLKNIYLSGCTRSFGLFVL